MYWTASLGDSAKSREGGTSNPNRKRQVEFSLKDRGDYKTMAHYLKVYSGTILRNTM